MNKKQSKYLIALLVPFIILISMIIIPLLTLFFGKEITLETRPYDPRDLFRGDYVVLHYKIDNVPINKFPKKIISREKEKGYKYYDFSKINNQDIYAVLSKNGKYYEVDHIALNKPKEEMYIKCKLTRNYYSYYDNFRVGSNVSISLDYSLDKYFVPENTGLELEKASREGKLVAKVKVFNGYALLTNVKSTNDDKSL